MGEEYVTEVEILGAYIELTDGRKWKGHPDLVDQLVSVDSLELDPENARRHDDFNIATIASALKEFGQQEALIVRPDGRLIAGEGRIRAIEQDPGLGWSHVAVITFRGTAEQARRLGLVHNRSSELGDWDPEGLATLLEQVQSDEATLGLGWRESDVENLLASIGRLGEREAGFLDDMAEGGGSREALVAGKGIEFEPQPRQLVFAASEAERAEAVKLIRTLQERLELPTATQTLLAVLRTAAAE